MQRKPNPATTVLVTLLWYAATAMLLALYVVADYSRQLPASIVLRDLLGGPIPLRWGGIALVSIIAMVAVVFRPGSVWLRLLGCIGIALWMFTGCLHSGLRVT